MDSGEGAPVASGHGAVLVRAAIIFLKKVFKPFQLQPAWYEELLINKFLEKKSNFQLTSCSDGPDKSAFKNKKYFIQNWDPIFFH